MIIIIQGNTQETMKLSVTQVEGRSLSSAWTLPQCHIKLQW